MLLPPHRLPLQLAALYPSPPIPLDHGSTFQFLCAVVLSAQSTDRKVNQVTPALFEAGGDAASMAALEVEQVRLLIREVGLAPSKAKYLVGLSKALLEKHGGEVPGDWKALEALPGVGHKTASVVMGQAFGVHSFPVDTHIHRLAARWGLSNGSTVERTELDLKALFEPDTWRDLHLQIIYYGREHGKAGQKAPWPGPICQWAGLDDPPATTPAGKARKRKASEESPAQRAAKAQQAEGTARKRSARKKL